MTDAGSFDKTAYREMLAKHKVTILTGKRLDAILDDGAEVVDKDGKRQKVSADSMVLAAGFAPQTTLKGQLEKEKGLEVYAVGDCVSPRRVFDAIHEGNLAARKL